MAVKRILTWAPNWSQRGGGGRWKKQIDGKVRFFGHGRSRSDSQSYRAAEQRYFEFMQRYQRRVPVSVVTTEATIEDVAEKYLQDCEKRYGRGDLSASYFSRVVGIISGFATFVGTSRRFSTLSELDLDDYRNHILSCPPSHPQSPSRGRAISMATARDNLAAVKMLVLWAYERRLSAELPRNLRTFARCTLPKPKVKTYSVEEVRNLWRVADRRLRCFMALALNCGYGQQDIADLRGNEIDWTRGVIDRERSKTEVRQRHALWPVTLELLAAEKDPAATSTDRVFSTSFGLPLVHDEVIDGKRKKSDSVKCLFWRAQQKTGIDGGRGFYCLRKTAATEIEKINPLVTEMFLAHVEKGQKKHYAERHYALLDEALQSLNGVFALTHAPVASVSGDAADDPRQQNGCPSDLPPAHEAVACTY